MLDFSEVLFRLQINVSPFYRKKGTDYHGYRCSDDVDCVLPHGKISAGLTTGLPHCVIWIQHPNSLRVLRNYEAKHQQWQNRHIFRCLQTSWFHRYHKTELRGLDKHCQPLTNDDCEKIIKDNRIDPKIISAARLKQEINTEIEELIRRTKRSFPLYLPNDVRLRCATPMFGFLVGLIGPITGRWTKVRNDDRPTQSGWGQYFPPCGSTNSRYQGSARIDT